MKAFKLLALTSCVLLAAGNGVAQQNYSKSEGLLQYVDPYIGSGYHGHVFVGTSVPQHHVAVQRQETSELGRIKNIDALKFTFPAVKLPVDPDRKLHIRCMRF